YNRLITSKSSSPLTESCSYNQFAQPSNYSSAVVTTPLYTRQLIRDAIGRVIARTETIGGVTSEYTYTYDAAGRRSVVTLNGSSGAGYDYDSNGNRLSVVSGGATRNGVDTSTAQIQQLGRDH